MFPVEQARVGSEDEALTTSNRVVLIVVARLYRVDTGSVVGRGLMDATPTLVAPEQVVAGREPT